MLLELLVRPNIWNLKPYSSARDEYKGKNASVFLDANENPYNAPYNRYPDPLQEDLKKTIANIKNVNKENIFLGNGSDEAIDLLFRIFCRPQIDNVVAISPTYGMYEVCANINDVEYRPVPLNDHFSLNAENIIKACDANTRLIFICSPNNPTGNLMDRNEILKIINDFQGIVVIDEAYADFGGQSVLPLIDKYDNLLVVQTFSKSRSMAGMRVGYAFGCKKIRSFRLDLNKYPNIVVLNTFSKAWGGAAIRLGMAFASMDIIKLFNKVKYPYNVNNLTQMKAKELLSDMNAVHNRIMSIIREKELIMSAIAELPIVKALYHSDANFFLVKVIDACKIYDYLIDRGVVVRNRNNVMLCDNCLRITVGTKEENAKLLAVLRQYKDV